METFLNWLFPWIATLIARRRQRSSVVVIIAIIAFISSLTVHAIAADRGITATPVSASELCLNVGAANADDLSRWGWEKYQSGQFDAARDCWRQARKQHQGAAAIADQINQAQAEQALGLYPLACKTLLPLYSPTTPDCTALPQTDSVQDDPAREQFLTQVKAHARTPDQIAGLRSLGNVLRSMGALELSQAVLSLDQIPDSVDRRLDLGNTHRALSDRSWDLYWRSGESIDLNDAIENAHKAIKHYETIQPVAFQSVSSATPDIIIAQQQAQLNQLSLLLSQQRELGCLLDLNQTGCRFEQQQQRIKIQNQSQASLKSEAQRWAREVQDRLSRFLTEKESSDSLSALLSTIEQLPVNHTTLQLRLNLAHSLITLPTLKNLPVDTISEWQSTLEPWLKTTIDLTQNNSREHSYALGYLGQWYQNQTIPDWSAAELWTQKALLVAQAIPAAEIVYQWQWQLGKIYHAQSQAPLQSKAQTETSLTRDRIPEARQAYNSAFETLQALRGELAASNPDTQFSFQQNIETVYREYVNLLLTEDREPSQPDLKMAREVIAALQAVEIENFLRQGCPENNLQAIDQIIDSKAGETTASFYPIVLESADGKTVRIEVILKLPDGTQAAQTQPPNPQKQNQEKPEIVKPNSAPSDQTVFLKHYRSSIDRQEFTDTIRGLLFDLEEEYTFYSVKPKAHKVYQWLLAEAEQRGYLSNIDTLVFALDTRLRNIPLAALVYDPNLNTPDRQGYLIEKYAVAIAPRLNLQVAERFPAKTLKVLAAGFSEKPTVKFKGRLSRRFFPALPYVKDELNRIASVGHGKLAVSQLLDLRFTTAGFQQAINTTAIDILHLATHGEFSSRPEGTFVLSADERVMNVNQLEQIFRDRNPQQANTIGLLILSACETATGDQRATLGISGVAVRAGARAAIASLWTLDDEVSVTFIEKLYEQLTQTTLTKVQALQAAQLALAKEEGYQHPRYWAPYIFVGNWL